MYRIRKAAKPPTAAQQRIVGAEADRIAPLNAATPRADIPIPKAKDLRKPETTNLSLSLGVPKGVFSFAKENTPFGTPRERLRLVVSGLRKSFAFGMGMSARGVAAFSGAIRSASAPTIRCCAAVGGFAALRMRYTPCGCRSAYLVEVRSNLRLPRHYSMRRAPAMPHSVSSLPPGKRHSRLTTVRRG